VDDTEPDFKCEYAFCNRLLFGWAMVLCRGVVASLVTVLVVSVSVSALLLGSGSSRLLVVT
jgi:hypothetical protein